MSKQSIHFTLLLKRFGIGLLLLTLVRSIFLLFNYVHFGPVSLPDFFLSFMHGIRFDASSLIYILSIFILASLIPFNLRSSKSYQKLLYYIFLISMGIGLTIELMDIRYYEFSMRRSTANVFNQSSDFFRLLPQFLKDFWYLFLILIGLLLIGSFLYRKTRLHENGNQFNTIWQVGFLFIGLSLCVLAARGGIQGMPITPLSATEMSSRSDLAPVINNTTINLLHSFQQRSLKGKTYFTSEKANALFPIVHTPDDTLEMDKKNIVIILMESFGKEHVGFYNGRQSYTPFLDSLLEAGLTFSHSFANGSRSNQAVVAVTTGIPSLMDDPLMISRYQGNQVEGIGNLLAPEGYSTLFFHGGNEGTFNIEVFARKAGFSQYFGREEYGNDKDYDGNWGIYDRPFMRYAGERLNQVDGPFCSVILTLSSHHPYRVEPSFRMTFPDLDPQIRSIHYGDYALRDFFTVIKDQPWTKNTLFIITADHIGRMQDAEYFNLMGWFNVPILFYTVDGNMRNKQDDIIQHIDILPSVLDYINFNKPYIQFGKSAFVEGEKRWMFNKVPDGAIIADREYVMHFNGDRVMGLHTFAEYPKISKDIRNEHPVIAEELAGQLKAIWQVHDEAMINNTLTVKSRLE